MFSQFNTFNNKGLDFNALSDEEKTFWTYASFNGGPGNASWLLDEYGSMDNITSQLDITYQGANVESWMKSVFGVVGGFELIKSYNPFSYQELGIKSE